MSASDCTTRVAEDTHVCEKDDKISGLLVNVFGLKLPNEMFSQAARYSDELAEVLHQYAKKLDGTKR